jgi:hypothetical protein
MDRKLTFLGLTLFAVVVIMSSPQLRVVKGSRPFFDPSVDSLSAANSIYPRNERLAASDGAAGDNFGRSVAISGNTAVVGAPHDGVGSNASQGSVYIYVRSGDAWVQQGSKLTASDGAADDYFGWSVAIDGDTIVVGAKGDDTTNSDRGSAYIFTRSGTTWSQTEKLTNRSDWEVNSVPESTSGEFFGSSVAIDGDRIVVGAPDDKTLNNAYSARGGSVSIFVKVSGTWPSSSTYKIACTENQALTDTRFGRSVDISGSTIIVGATEYSDVAANAGAVFILPTNSSATPSTFDTLVTRRFDGASSNAYLGNSVSIDTDVAVIGRAYGSAAYVSTLSSGTWGNLTQLSGGGSGANDFGESVFVDDDTVVIGTEHGTGSGSAYIYRKIGGSWTYKATITQSGLTSTSYGIDSFGTSVAVHGTNIIAGAYTDATFSTTQSGRGSASMFRNVVPAPFDFGGNGYTDISVFRPLTSSSEWYVTDPKAGGYTVSTLGATGDEIAPADYDGDGKTDYTVFRPSTGVWYIYNSSTSTFSYATWGTTSDIPIPNDFDNDGKADVAVYRPSTYVWYWINSSNAGTNSVTFGQSGDKPIMADFDGDARGELALFRPSTNAVFAWYNLATSSSSSTSFGVSTDIPAVGDFDGDAKTDVCVFRPSNSTFYWVLSSNSGSNQVTYGASGDIPTVGWRW